MKTDGRRSSSSQRFRCRAGRRTCTARTGTPCARHRWPLEVITAAGRWHCRYRLSAAAVRDRLAERRIDGSARTVLAWVHTFGPLLAAVGRRHARPVGTRWYTDETYVRVAGRWRYLYRAVDEHGHVVDGLLRERRDLASARAFFGQAVARRGGRPKVVITDKHAAYRRAVRRRAGRALWGARTPSVSAQGAMGDHHAVLDWCSLLVGIVLASLKGRRALAVEHLLLRQQLSVALRAPPLPRIRRRDRLFWVVARRLCAAWRRHLVLVRPETVLRWHRRGWRLVWWRSA